MVAQPYGTHPFNFILQGGQNLWRVQIKAVAYMREGLYDVTICHSQGRKLRNYTRSEIDFVAVYIIPEDTWYILPVHLHDMTSRSPAPCQKRQGTGHPDVKVSAVSPVGRGHRSAHQQVPRLRIAIEKANRNAPLGMTDFSKGQSRGSSLMTNLVRPVRGLSLQQNHRCVIVQAGAVGECAHILENAFR
jgi:hypothetical protein